MLAYFWVFKRRYTNITVGQPTERDEQRELPLAPQQCRLRDVSYSAPITVDVEYVRGREVIVCKGKNAITIGRMPMMLRCDRCAGGRCRLQQTVYQTAKCCISAR
jgi:DNA-directed RNA polymerase III subunit RPC2